MIGLLLLLLPIGAFQEPVQQEPAKSRQPVYLSLSAKQGNGVYVRDLRMQDISVRLDGKPVELRFFGSRNVDTAFVLLIENSPRTAEHDISVPQYGRINTVDHVRYHLMNSALEQITARGPVLIAEFYRELEVLEDFTQDSEILITKIHRMRPNVSSIGADNISIGRMLGRGVDLLRNRPEKRKALVLFTTSIDRDSVRDLREYQDMFRFADVDLYVVSFASRSAFGPTYSGAEKVSRSSFLSLVNETGGNFYLSGEYTYIEEFLDDLTSRLVNSYTVGFYVYPEQERRRHAVDIKIDRKKCRLKYRKKLIY